MWSRKLKCVLLIALAPMVMVGCTRSVPLMSHAHIGHALTAWRGTPNEQGLLVVAERESGVALEHANAALDSSRNANDVRRHLERVAHMLSPNLEQTNSNHSYGAVRALQGAASHVTYAGEMNDASENINAASTHFEHAAQSVIAQLQIAAEAARLGNSVAEENLSGLALEVHALVSGAVHGKDSDGDGVIGNTTDEFGLKQLRQLLHATLDAEDPPYHPIGRLYLLGLIRLPNGQWTYRPNAKPTPYAQRSTY